MARLTSAQPLDGGGDKITANTKGLPNPVAAGWINPTHGRLMPMTRAFSADVFSKGLVLSALRFGPFLPR
jgi:hypothetical protein